jgi:hypothetical protein
MSMHGWHEAVGRRAARRGLAVLSLTVVSLGSLACHAVAQTAVPEEYAARSVARIGLLDLRARPNPTPDDYLIVERLLGTAAALQPGDAELVRSRIRAAWAAGDSEQVDVLTRQLLALDPRDTVAQLRLASSRIRRIQTVEARLAAYDRLIGPAGSSIDPAVRSRLALDAGLLCRESGNFVGFADRLAQATQLDQTNKDAAALAWTYFGPMLESRVERIELLLNLLMADPTDPNVYRQVALECSLAGAFAQAQRFHSISLALYSAAGAPERAGLVTESSVIRWQVEGPAAVVESLNRDLAIMRQQASNLILQYEQARMPTDSLTKPEAIVLSSTFNHIRLVAALMADDRETIEATLVDMSLVLQQSINQVAETSKLSLPEERRQQMAELWGELSQQLISIAWADLQTESLAEWADRANDILGVESPASIMLSAWRELRLGDPVKAEEMFRSVQDQTALNRVGLGIALEEIDRQADAVEVYRVLALERPMSLSGVWARDQHRKLTGVDPMATAERAAAARLGNDVPAWVDRMASEPRSFMGLRAEVVQSTVGATERAGVRIRLINLAPIPLGVGGDRPINSRLLFVPRLRVGTDDEFDGAVPEVIELGHRLRLMPTESIDLVVMPDAGVSGWIAEVGAVDSVRERWHVLQGYMLDGRGVPTPGMMCLEADTGRVDRVPLRYGRVSGLELADALEGASASELPSVIAAIRARALIAPESAYGLSVDEIERIAGIAAARYPGLSVVSRAMMLAVLPSARLAQGMAAFDAVALAEADSLLVPVVLVTRVTEPDDAALAGWLASETDGLGSFARALRDRLSSPEPTFSRLDVTMLRVAGSSAR